MLGKIIMLSEISQAQRDNYHLFSLMCKIRILTKGMKVEKTIWEEERHKQEREG
jgi:hypothetical protein